MPDQLPRPTSEVIPNHNFAAAIQELSGYANEAQSLRKADKAAAKKKIDQVADQIIELTPDSEKLSAVAEVITDTPKVLPQEEPKPKKDIIAGKLRFPEELAQHIQELSINHSIKDIIAKEASEGSYILYNFVWSCISMYIDQYIRRNIPGWVEPYLPLQYCDELKAYKLSIDNEGTHVKVGLI